MTPKTFDPRQHNYLRKLLTLDLERGAGYEVRVLHDDWCAFFAGGACDCDPELVPVKVTP